MGSLSLTHVLLFLIIVLVFFGPTRLPGLGKSLGEAIRGFKKGLEGVDPNTNDEEKQQHQVSSRHVSPLELSESGQKDPTKAQTKKTDHYS